mgnify:CR=1 FL=1
MAVSVAERLTIAAMLAAAFLTALPPYRLTAQVDPTGRWRTLETEQFDVQTRAGTRDVALRAAGEAEAAYAEFARFLPAPRSRIDLVVADNTGVHRREVAPYLAYVRDAAGRYASREYRFEDDAMEVSVLRGER